MSSLSQIREEYSQAKKDFEAEKRHEWSLIAKGYELQMSAEARRLHDAGMSKAAIMREYGTSDYKTVNDLLKQTPSQGTVQRPKWTENSDGTYEVTDGKTTAVVTPLHDEEELFIESGKLPRGITYASLPRNAY